MAEIPSKQPILSRIFGKSAVYDIVLAPLAIVGSALQTYAFFVLHQPVRGWLLGLTGTGVLVVSVIKASNAFFRELEKDSPHELEGCLYTLYAILAPAGAPSSTNFPRLRLTVHKPVDGGKQLEQVMEYIGALTTERKSAGRRLPAQSGIIGMAYAKRTTVVADRLNSDHEAFVRELQDDWHFSEFDAREANPSINSWMAVPMVKTYANSETVEGILYLDCTVRGFFTPDRVEIAVAACEGIARFVSHRYK